MQEFNYIVVDDKLWKRTYVEKWLKDADAQFLNANYPVNFPWREMYKLRATVEFKYLYKVINSKSLRIILKSNVRRSSKRTTTLLHYFQLTQMIGKDI